MSKVFAADEIRLNLVNILDGAADPTVGPGVARPIGSFYTRTAGSPGLYQKTGALATDWEKLSQSLAWRSISDFGAIADGVTDATAAIQAAIAEVAALGGGVVYVPRGTFAITQLTITATTGVQVLGTGPDSVLLWTFDAATLAASAVTVTANTTAIRFANLRFDGSGLTNPAASRENHLLLLNGAGGGVLETRVEECWFGGMVAASGDGVHVVGTAGNLVNRAWIRDNVFDGCSRYGIGVEQGWRSGWIIDSYFTNNETDIGIVATANVATQGVNISNNEIVHTGAERRAVRLEGDATGLLTYSLFSNNLILGGYLTISNAQYLNVYGNPIFSGTFVSTDPVIRVFGTYLDSLIMDNVIDRQGVTAGPCLGVEPVGAAVPSRFRIGNNVMVQEVASANFMTVVDATRFSIGGNVCRATDAGASTIFAIDAQAVTVALDDALIGPGNQVTAAAGTFAAAVRLLANGANVLGVSIVSNLGNQIVYGAQFEVGGGGGNFTTNIIMFGGNVWNATTDDFNNVGTTVIPRVGFNAGTAATTGAQLFTGSGTPEGVVTARVGSMYLNRTGGAGTAVWYKETGGAALGWVAMGGSALVFGTGDTTVAATAVFFAPGYGAIATATEIQMPITRTGTIRNLRVQVATAGTTAETVTFTVRIGGVDTAITTTIDNTATGLVTDLVNTAAVVAGNLVSISITKTGIVVAGQADVIASLELV
jgi:hypothetical protein